MKKVLKSFLLNEKKKKIKKLMTVNAKAHIWDLPMRSCLDAIHQCPNRKYGNNTKENVCNLKRNT